MWSLVIIKFEIIFISPNEKEKITYIIENHESQEEPFIIEGEFQIEIKFELLIRLQNEQHMKTLVVVVVVIIQCYSIL